MKRSGGSPVKLETGLVSCYELGRQPVAIAGPAGLHIGETVSWKVMLVWAGLIAAIAVVGWLVYSLLRENAEG